MGRVRRKREGKRPSVLNLEELEMLDRKRWRWEKEGTDGERVCMEI